MNTGQNGRAFGAGMLCATVLGVALGLLTALIGAALTSLGCVKAGHFFSQWTPLHVTLHSAQEVLQGAYVGLGFILAVTILSWGVKRFDEWH